jgi:hypothetical protein
MREGSSDRVLEALIRRLFERLTERVNLRINKVKRFGQVVALPAASPSRAPDFDLVLSVRELALLGQRRGQRSTLIYVRLP